MSVTKARDKLKFSVPVVEALGVARAGEAAMLGHHFSYDPRNMASFMNRVADAFPLDIHHAVVVDGFPNKDRLRSYHAALSLEVGSKFPEQTYAYSPDGERLKLEVRRVG